MSNDEFDRDEIAIIRGMVMCFSFIVGTFVFGVVVGWCLSLMVKA